MKLNERVRFLLTTLIDRNYCRNKSAFAKEMGVSSSTLSSVIVGRLKVPKDMLERILMHYPIVSREWLLREEGEPFTGSIGESSSGLQIPQKNDAPKSASEEREESLRRAVAEYQNQQRILLEQINRLLSIIERMQDGKDDPEKP